MKRILSLNDIFVLRFDSGEEVVSGLKEFALENKIISALVSGVSSSKEAELGYYDVNSGEYVKKTYIERLEVVNLTGNIAVLENGPTIHLHGSFSTREYGVLGGRVHNLVTNATMEVSVKVLSEKIERKHDPTTGLNLLE